MNSWAMVELFRNEHGRLPKDETDPPLDFAKAFKAAARNVGDGKVDPFNAGQMLELASEICESVNFVKGRTPIDGKCFACEKQESKFAMEITDKDAGQTFTRNWCYDCCKKVFSDLREAQ